MTDQSYLTFSLHGMHLAIDAKAVREILWLPELTPVEEVPIYIAGLVNMRGKIVPVMDLTVRFGHAPQKYGCSDRVIVLGVSDLLPQVPDQQVLFPAVISRIALIGVIVSEVLDVLAIPEDSIEPSPYEKTEPQSHPRFISGEAKTGEDIIMIMDPRTFLELEFGNMDSYIEKPEIIPESATGYFCPEAGPEERVIFHKRAMSLAMTYDENSEREIPVAVVTLNNEYMCVELEAVHEFSKIHNFTTVPCCPGHIAGNMNLRGNVLTLIDISGMLNIRAGSISESTKVIVADSGEYPVGVIVDDVLDVMYLRAVDIVPVSSSTRALNEKFVKGAAPYGSGMMAVLDLEEILSWDGLIVNEEV